MNVVYVKFERLVRNNVKTKFVVIFNLSVLSLTNIFVAFFKTFLQ